MIVKAEFYKYVLIEKWSPPTHLEVDDEYTNNVVIAEIWKDKITNRYKRNNGLPCVETKNKHIYIKDSRIWRIDFFNTPIETILIKSITFPNAIIINQSTDVN